MLCCCVVRMDGIVLLQKSYRAFSFNVKEATVSTWHEETKPLTHTPRWHRGNMSAHFRHMPVKGNMSRNWNFAYSSDDCFSSSYCSGVVIFRSSIMAFSYSFS